MGMKVTIDDDFHRQKHEAMAQLALIRDSLCEQIINELDAIMEQVKADAISLCPKDTGALASSINLTGGAISSSSNFYEASIYAGDENIINPKTGKPTSEYAQLVEEGHEMRDGSFWEGSEFLSQAMQMHEAELEACVDRALKELGSINPSASKVAEMESE